MAGARPVRRLLIANLVASVAVAPRPLSLPARLVTLAQGFLLAGVTVGTVGALHGDALAEPRRGALAVLLLAGWLGLTVLGSLVHLLGLLGHVRDLSRPQPRPRPTRDRALVAVAATAVSALAAAHLASADALRTPGAAALLLVYAVLGVHVLILAGRALGRPRQRRPLV